MFLSFSAAAAHNFFHQKDNWRMYIFDLMVLSSKGWRISHAMSHHVFPNTIYDYEISSFEPMLQFLPKSSKTITDRYVSHIYSFFIFAFGFFMDVYKRLMLTYYKEIQPSKENFLQVAQIIFIIFINGTVFGGIWYD